MKSILIAGAVVLSVAASAAHAQVLYNNGPVVDGSGLSILTPPATTLGVSSTASQTVADNFSIAGASWNVTSLGFYAYQTSAVGFTFTNATWSIISGSNINTGTVVASGSTGVTNGGLVGYRVTDTTLTSTARAIYLINADITDLTLASGNYFLTWALAGTSASGPFVPPVVGSLGTGNAQFSASGAAYAPITDAGSLQTMDLPFQIYGTANAVAGVPEPTTWALMVLGFGAIGGAMRRRAKVTAVTFA